MAGPFELPPMSVQGFLVRQSFFYCILLPPICILLFFLRIIVRIKVQSFQRPSRRGVFVRCPVCLVGLVRGPAAALLECEFRLCGSAIYWFPGSSLKMLGSYLRHGYGVRKSRNPSVRQSYACRKRSRSAGSGGIRRCSLEGVGLFTCWFPKSSRRLAGHNLRDGYGCRKRRNPAVRHGYG